jgi:hypothetical protein
MRKDLTLLKEQKKMNKFKTKDQILFKEKMQIPKIKSQCMKIGLTQTRENKKELIDKSAKKI